MAREVVIVDAIRTPTGKRGGGLASVHSSELLGPLLRELFDRTGVDPAVVGQVIGGCVSQVGMQSSNTTRTAWLRAGLPEAVAATTVDSQCGSSQQASSLAYALIAAGLTDVAVSAGVENMSSVPMGSTIPKDPFVGKALTRGYWQHHEFTTQFEAAERIADKWGITRQDCDELGLMSQERAAKAWSDGRFDRQVVPVTVSGTPGEDGVATESIVAKDEGLRATTLEALGALKPSGRPDGVHTAGTSSQIADGASAVLMMSRTEAERQGLTPLATIVDACLVGSDPTIMLEGPIHATNKLLKDNDLKLSDLDVVEINEAFASVVLAWQRAFETNLDKVNPNGGAIANGHPLGATGGMLIAKAVDELVQLDGQYALVTMCCAGGLGTGTLLRRA